MLDKAPGRYTVEQVAEAVREYLERRHSGDWSRVEVLETRWSNEAPDPESILALLTGDASPTPNGSLLLYADVIPAAAPEGTPSVPAPASSPTVRRLPVQATVRAWILVPVAARDLPRGTFLSIGDSRLEERPMAELRGGRRLQVDLRPGGAASATPSGSPVPAPASPQGRSLPGNLSSPSPWEADPGPAARRWRTRREIKAGEILLASAVEEPPVVSPGGRVTIRLVSGPLRVTAAGIARRAGRAGDVIPVEVVDSRRTLMVSIVDAWTVELAP